MQMQSRIDYSQTVGYQGPIPIAAVNLKAFLPLTAISRSLQMLPCKSHLLQVLVGLFLISSCGPATGGDSRNANPEIPAGNYLNPLGDPVIHMADPYVLVHKGKYYLFGTASPSEGFQCYESSDLARWKLDGWAWRRSAIRAARGELHAPQVVLYQDMFCLIYSARMVGGIQLGLAAATKPEGPYHDLHVPWLSLGDSCSSADLFIDDNGKAFLTFSRRSSREGCACSTIYGVALNRDLSGIIGEPVKMLEPTQRWELARRDSVRYNEAPRMFKISGKYYLTYCANDPLSTDCAIGYARADKPLGPWTKATENPLLSNRSDRGVAGLGQGSVFRSLEGGERFMVYSAWADPVNLAAGRTVSIDRLVLENRKLSVLGPTRSPQPLPGMPK
jgi:beta-xylosidase